MKVMLICQKEIENPEWPWPQNMEILMGRRVRKKKWGSVQTGAIA
jgi:hypothetical protein